MELEKVRTTIDTLFLEDCCSSMITQFLGSLREHRQIGDSFEAWKRALNLELSLYLINYHLKQKSREELTIRDMQALYEAFPNHF